MSINISKEEEEILKFWKEIDVFETRKELSKEREEFSFIDGPPFATGKPHYGHLLAGTIKDTVLRYAYSKGKHVDPVFGWDCHGLPIEYEIDKKFGRSGKMAVEKYGIEAYNKACREIVMTNSSSWEHTTERIARWIDYRNGYKTMNKEFMESVWWVFKTLFDKNLVYNGVRVMPYSTACTTPLSNFEVALEYKDVLDYSVIAKFQSISDPSTFYLIWTTTPWTLTSNMALCVNPSMDYISASDGTSHYVFEESRLEYVQTCLKKELKVAVKMKGSELKGKGYKPIFNYFVSSKWGENKHTIIADNYVEAGSGTGIVHQAPAFGEDDLRCCVENGIVTVSNTPCPLDEEGKFISPVSDYIGLFYKDADKQVVIDLKTKGDIVFSARESHSVPHCWRSGTPLIYRAIPSWFVKVSEHVDSILDASKKSKWVPSVIQEKRFHNWIASARDWTVSRNRFWGTPIPIWESKDLEEVVCIGSIKELEELSGVKGISDLHREFVDKIEIPSKQGKGNLKRTDAVFDCWFESGSVPYGSIHYPFENKESFKKTFPADFIAEGLDQTRGWFYTLTVLGTHLFGECPFKNVIVNGIVLAKDGRKMSKSLKNYPDPLEVISAYGADALRMYLFNSPAVHAEPIKFSKEGVESILKELILPWHNASRFLEGIIEEDHIHDLHSSIETENISDRWILSSVNSLIKEIDQAMGKFDIQSAVSPIYVFVENLTNWYIRLNRVRLKEKAKDSQMAADVLFRVLYLLCLATSSFCPFFSENIYQRLKKHLKHGDAIGETNKSIEGTCSNKRDKELNRSKGEIEGACNNKGDKESDIPSKSLEGASYSTGDKDTRSVHFILLPSIEELKICAETERRFLRMKEVVEMVRMHRETNKIQLKFPLSELRVFCYDKETLNDLDTLSTYIKSESNIKRLLLSTDVESLKFETTVHPNFKILGPRIKNKMKIFKERINGLNQEEIDGFLRSKEITIEDIVLGIEDLEIKRKVKVDDEHIKTSWTSHFVLFLDVNISDELIVEGTTREIYSIIQQLRKKAGFKQSQIVNVYIEINKIKPESNLPLLEKSINGLDEMLNKSINRERPKEEIVEVLSDLLETNLKISISKFPVE
eukprot:GHVP01053735.1.p1 GENE.GHVP01053735.1~~GHVP01053735.1.p1  ORF type:complete len:1109 (+),score=210.72 GHVP01053735.1:1100-4426(+)